MNKKNPYRTKMKPDELREYLAFKRKQGCVPAKKGKGSYNRKKLNNEKEWQKMYVYIVIEDDAYEESKILGVFSDEKTARDFLIEAKAKSLSVIRFSYRLEKHKIK